MKQKRTLKKILFVSLLILMATTPSFGATRTVMQSGGDYSTIQECADAADEGDTCLVSSGSYGGVTVTKSGSSDQRIRFVADTSGSQPVITGNFNVTNERYITIEGFNLRRSVTCNGCSFIEIKNNKFTNTDIGVGGGSNELDGTDILVDGNIFGDRGDDVVKGNGDRWVIRNNVATGINDSQDEHIDFYQNSCLKLPGDFVLIENNTYADITGSNTHFFLINCSTGRRTNYIIRHNKVRNLGSMAVTFDDSAGGTGFDGATAYNNTFVRVRNGRGDRTYAISMSDVDTGRGAQNNIYYDSINPNDARGATPSSNNCDGSLVYDPNDASIRLNECLENSSGVVINKDPKFNNAGGNDFSLQSDSPAIDAGYHLTTVAGSDSGSGTTLMVNNPYYFQDGWAGVPSDWIAVGPVSNTVQISSINYSTGAITLSRSISRSDGDPVYLYRDSDGTQVLSGSAPDIGAVESNGKEIPNNLRF
jgi:hypothetical protein